jgi:hypothetical protein
VIVSECLFVSFAKFIIGVMRMIYVAAIVLAEGDSVITNRSNPPTEPKNLEYLANTSLYTFKVLLSSIFNYK